MFFSLKKAAVHLFKKTGCASVTLYLLLKLHTWAYQCIGMWAVLLEPDGVHPKHRLMKYHQWFVDRIRPDWTVVDVGCGNGALTFDLRKKCKRVIALDTSKENIRRAQKQYSCDDIHYRVADARGYIPDMPVDAVVLSNVLEHIQQRNEFLSHWASYAEFFLVRVPMLNRDWLTLYKKEKGVVMYNA